MLALAKVASKSSSLSKQVINKALQPLLLLPPPSVIVNITAPTGFTVYEARTGDRAVRSLSNVFTASLYQGMGIDVCGYERASIARPFSILYDQEQIPIPAQITILGPDNECTTQLAQRNGLWQRLPAILPAVEPPVMDGKTSLMAAQQTLGFKMKVVNHQGRAVAVLMPIGSNNIMQDGWVVGVHGSPVQLIKSLAGLNGANPERFRLESRSLAMDDQLMQEAAQRARKLSRVEAYSQLHNVFEQIYVVREQDRMRQLVVTAPAHTVLGKPAGAANGLAGTRPLSPGEWAHLAYATQVREPTNDGIGLTQSPLHMAIADVQYDSTGYSIGDRPFAYWRSVLEPDQIETVLDHNADVIVEMTNLQGRFVVNSAIRGGGSQQTIRELFRILPADCEVVHGASAEDDRHLQRLHLSILPGSPHRMAETPLPKSNSGMVGGFVGWLVKTLGVSPQDLPKYTHVQPAWRQMLETLGAHVDAAGSACGDLPIGRTLDGRLITFRRGDINAVIFLGPSGSGKTVAMETLAHFISPLVWTISLSTPRNPWVGRWTQKLGGEFIEVNVEQPSTPEEFDSAAKELRAEAETEARRLEVLFRREGKIAGFPRYHQKGSGNTYLWFEWIRQYLELVIPIVGAAAVKYNSPAVLCIDELIAAGVKDTYTDPLLGNRAANTCEGLRRIIQTLADTLRHSNMFLGVTAHGWASLFELYGHGFAGDYPLAIGSSARDGRVHKVAEMWYPPEVNADRIWEVKLPSELEEGEKPSDPPSGWLGFFNPDLDKSVFDLMGVPY